GLAEKIPVDRKFFDRPADLPMLEGMKTILQLWLANHGVGSASANAIVERLPSYFVYALSQEWRRNLKSYKPLLDAIDTPFSKAGDREWGWTSYAALLQRRIQECVFDEPFGLSQIYIPLNAFYQEEKSGKGRGEEMMRTGEQRQRVVIELEKELESWLRQSDPADVIRVISGGPGSGKSSFARIFAARVAEREKVKVLFVPLHLIDPGKDLADEVGRFVRDEGVLSQNPLDPESPEPNLLIIFDGLDELASQGKAAAETARAFVREVEKTVERRNMQSLKLRVLLSGRELVVQENESEFRRPRQILTLLPYIPDGDGYHDPANLLKQDKRQDWWKNYGQLTGKDFKGLPKELEREDLKEVTAQPLLNYLVALSYTRGQLDFSKGDINLNSVYEDLVKAVHERGYEKGRAHSSIRHMTLDSFFRVLEEIGLAAWHGDGRTTTVKEIETHCLNSGLGKLLEDFKEGAEAGVTRLLAAFFFRQYGQRASGDPTFVFTHKSFGEYLTARRVVRAIEKMILQLERRDDDPDDGWDERETLKHWAQIYGPSAMTNYLHSFLLNEVRLRSIEEMERWQNRLAKLFSYMLRHGMPMEQLPIATFQDALFQSRNAEESLLIALNSCARMTKQVSTIEHPDQKTFGAWFKRMQGQRASGENVLAAKCMSFLDLSSIRLDMADFYRAQIYSSNLRGTVAYYACFIGADLHNADLHNASLFFANLESTNLEGANLEGANLEGAKLEGAKLPKKIADQLKLNSRKQPGQERK
ncbi:MAG: pentapeptide repeat-containing protein, partial [Acidobacteriota bacterium]